METNKIKAWKMVQST